MRRRTAQVVPCVALASALVAGCGASNDYKNEPRPPAPIVVTASINKQAVAVSPQRFGAGPPGVHATDQLRRLGDLAGSFAGWPHAYLYPR